MIDGHGDDLHKYRGISINFSSNIYAHADLSGLKKHLADVMDIISSYPEPSAASLEEMIACEYGIQPSQVMVTAGATDAIYLIAQTFRHLRSYTIERPTFSEYDDACRVFGWHEERCGELRWLCNPNNPTGQVMENDEVGSLAGQYRLLVVDCSYEDYTLCQRMSPQDILRYDNVIQVHSMTKKYAIPGLRLGFVVAPKHTIQLLRKGYRPWAANALAIEAGKWLLRQGSTAIIDLHGYLAEAHRLRCTLNDMEGIEAMETKTNFFLCCLKHRTAHDLKLFLAERHGMLIRDASNFIGLTPRHFRVAAQSREENDALVSAMKEYLQT